MSKAEEFLKERNGITYDMIDYTHVDMIDFAEAYFESEFKSRVNAVINQNIKDINKNHAMLGDVKYERTRALEVVKEKLLKQ